MNQKRKTWLLEIIVALAAATSLLMFYFPHQPDELVCVEGHENHGSWLEHKEIFPTLGILFGKSYRCLHLYGKETTYLLDFALPDTYFTDDSLRLWIRPKDWEQICVDPDIEVRCYAVDIQNSYTQQWTHYTAQHPHGHGAFLALGIILTMLFIVLIVKRIFFNPDTMKFP